MSYSPQIMLRYPHMGPLEIEIWTAFLERHRTYYQAFEYDVKVGEGQSIDPEWPQWLQRQVSILSKRRIDAVGYAPGERWILEVKPDLGASVIGQLLLYKRLYIEKYSPRDRIILAAVGRRWGLDLESVYNEFGIKVYLV